VIIALTFSLVECLLILPPHLAHMRPPRAPRNALLRRLESWRQACADALMMVARQYYRPFLKFCLKHNPTVVALFVVVLFMSLALYGGGWLRTAFFPTIQSDYVQAEIDLLEGRAYRETLERLQQAEAAAVRVKAEYNSDERYSRQEPAIGHITSLGRESTVKVTMEVRSRDLDTQEVAERWREYIGDIGEVQDFRMDYTINDRGKPIKLDLSAGSLDELRAVSAELMQILQGYPGVYNVYSSLQAPKDEIVLDLKPAAENLSVSLAELARQVREAFYGSEAQRIPRAREDVRVMVRYPEHERVAVENLSDMRIRTPAGSEVPFDTVAEVRYEPGYLTIDRQDRRRTLEVTAELAPGGLGAAAIVDEVIREHLPRWQQQYPSLQMGLDGELEEERDFMNAMIKYMGLSMLVIYGLMAVPFRSYWQPLLVLTAVPFGIMGGIFGHLILNWQISVFSLLGVIACAGVVVNDNLVLIDRVNQLRATGHSLHESLLQGAQDRFRPIILTSLTTFIGLLPIMSETSVQAQFLIPMVTSLAFGVLFATGVTLLLVPCLYLMGEEVGRRLLRLPAPPADEAESLIFPPEGSKQG
jgi:multidrug efflux pump subunit AcrB